jgi:poly(A) polymerase
MPSHPTRKIKTMSKQASAPFPTSREILQRIHWDPRLGAEHFVVGYEERFQGRKERKAKDFPMNGEIPWHRVWTIRQGDTIVWDREHRIDRMEEAPALIAHIRNNQPEADDTTTGYTYCNQQTSWQPAPCLPTPLPARMRVATYNVLFDLYDKDLLHTKQRIPGLVQQMQDMTCDILALQEVTPTFLDALCQQEWVREHYFLSTIPDSPALGQYGQIVLSRFPVQHVDYLEHSRHKRTLIVTLATTPFPICVAVVHLTSNRRKQAAERRTEQLSQLVALRHTPHPQRPPQAQWLIMGDFNSRGNEPSTTLEAAGFIDAWELLHPDTPGYTFDPDSNPLAAIASQSQTPGRLDRIFVQAEHAQLFPSQAHITATKPIRTLPTLGPLHPSDHYALQCIIHTR